MNKMFKLSGVAAALILSGVLVGCGSSSKDKKDGTPPTPPAQNKKATITVIDGYVVGAKVQSDTVKEKVVTTTAQGVAADVEYKGDSPVFTSTGGKTKAGLLAPSMVTKMVKDGKAIINPFTTYAASGGNVTKLLTDLKVDAKYAVNAMGDYTKDTGEDHADFSKAVVAYSRIMYCEGKAANDNATNAAKAATKVVEDASGATTKQVLDSLGNNTDVKAQEAVKAVADVNDITAAQGVAAIEQAIAADLGSGKDGCKAGSTPTPPAGCIPMPGRPCK